ncbi:MAG: hypothetical protein R3325_03415 [Thermoanaerobaculia bacterium]|nr:hypothetical protein [Thermoanaerobaculia bacterium]
MALNGFIETWATIGAINTNAATTTSHNFPPSRVWTRPLLQRLVTYDDNASVNAYVTSTVSGGVTNGSNRAGAVVSNCTKVTFRVTVDEAYARYACVTIFF